MYPILSTAILLVLIPYLVFTKKYKILFVLALISAFNEFLFLSFGTFNFSLSFVIMFWIILIEKKIIIFEKSYFGGILWVILLLMTITGYYFVLFAPWEDLYKNYRTITQQLPLRTTVGLIRYIELIFTFYLFYFFFKNKYVDFLLFVRTASIIVLVSFFVGMLDYAYFGGVIRKFLIPGHYVLSRFTGLAGEPRRIGQIYGMIIFLIVAFGFNRGMDKKLSLVTILVAFAGIGLSFSSTAIGFTVFVLLIYSLLGRVEIKYFITSGIILVIGLLFMLNNEKFVEHQQERIALVALESSVSQIPNVPPWINRFEVFDRSALAFLFFNPTYSIFGVGPNTVNIPASKYLSEYDIGVYGGQIDTAPFTFVVNIVSSAGFLGLFTFLGGIVFVLSQLIKNRLTHALNLLLLFSIYFILYNNFIFYIVIGSVCGYMKSFAKLNNLKYAINNYTGP
mgnify:CR=1 FL=1